jgi:hypothetical protein
MNNTQTTTNATRTTQFIKSFLNSIGIADGDYKLKENQDDSFGYLVSITLSKTNPKIGTLFGKEGRHLRIFKQLIRVVSKNEGLSAFLIIKLE